MRLENSELTPHVRSWQEPAMRGQIKNRHHIWPDAGLQRTREPVCSSMCRLVQQACPPASKPASQPDDKGNLSEITRVSRTGGFRTRSAGSRTSAGRSSYVGSRTGRLTISNLARRADTRGGGHGLPSELSTGRKDLPCASCVALGPVLCCTKFNI